MCKSNNADEICQVHIDDYISKYRNGIRPAVFFCFHIRGTVLLALQNRSLESKSTAERPPFAEELVNNPKNFWPLLSGCNLNYSGKGTRVKKKKSSAYQQVQRSHGTPDALASALQGLNLDEGLGSEDIQEVMTTVMQRSSVNKQSKTGQAKQRTRIVRPTRLNRGEQVRAAGFNAREPVHSKGRTIADGCHFK
ncbi:unnamed protein product [Fusarium equiseti]|uniref:Uncharacterized protein n=1 Tax=Fusarium equiseti TaxID=61235 RepID=A0A8J2NES6_FUSEQ|nr:unnamed protein product [Fusarium equiseti]